MNRDAFSRSNAFAANSRSWASLFHSMTPETPDAVVGPVLTVPDLEPGPWIPKTVAYLL